MKTNFKRFFTEDADYGSYFRKLKADGEAKSKKQLSALDPNKRILEYRDVTVNLNEHFVVQRAKYKARNFLTDDQICEMIVKFIDKIHEINIVDALDTPPADIEESVYLVYSKIMHSAIMLSKRKGVARTYNLFNIFPQRSKSEKYHTASIKDKEIIIEGLSPEVSDEFAEYLQYLTVGTITISEDEKKYCNLPKAVKFEDGTKLTLLFSDGKLWDINEVCFFEIS